LATFHGWKQQKVALLIQSETVAYETYWNAFYQL
jgi:hypothetical protein